MVRSTLCTLLLFAAPLLIGNTVFASAAASLPSASAAGPIQGTLGHPLQLGPWQVTVEQASRVDWQNTSALVIPVTLRNTSRATQPLDSAQLLTCYRNDVWQALQLLGGDPLPHSSVAPGKETYGRLIYQLPPDVLTFGLVFFWHTPAASATGIWLLTLH